MKVEETIKKAMKAIMVARPVVISTPIPVRTHFDHEGFDGDYVIVVEAQPKKRIEPNYDFYRVELRCNAVSLLNNDTVGKWQDLLYAECSDEIQEDLTKATLQAAINVVDAASGITVDGLVPTDGGFLNEEEYSLQFESTLVSFTYTNPIT